MRYFIVSLLILIMGCTSTPKKTVSPITTFECYDTPNLKEQIKQGEDLNGKKINCQGKIFIIDTYLIYGPDELIILNQNSGRWENYLLDQCELL